MIFWWLVVLEQHMFVSEWRPVQILLNCKKVIWNYLTIEEDFKEDLICHSMVNILNKRLVHVSGPTLQFAWANPPHPCLQYRRQPQTPGPWGVQARSKRCRPYSGQAGKQKNQSKEGETSDAMTLIAEVEWKVTSLHQIHTVEFSRLGQYFLD